MVCQLSTDHPSITGLCYDLVHKPQHKMETEATTLFKLKNDSKKESIRRA